MWGRGGDRDGFDLAKWLERKRENIHRLASRGHVPLWRELLRVLYLSACILVDGLVVGEVLARLADPWRWPAFFVALAVAVFLEWRLYRVLWPDGWDEPPAAS